MNSNNIKTRQTQQYASEKANAERRPLFPSRLRLLFVAVVCFVTGTFVYTQSADDEAKESLMMQMATIKTCGDHSATVGSAMLIEKATDEGVKEVDVTIEINASEISAGKHAVHIHETGACTPCSAAKGHFDPGPHGETSPDGNHPFHMGDLVNIEIDETGSGRLAVTTTRVTLSDGPLSINDEDGSALIVHVGEDTYCPEGEAAGCAGGARAACGVIGLVDVEE